ncbi:MAG: hypothetical protein PF505_09095 [Vallitaleaceae bacterium]|nr:hypothetical protein [Vallitaleaceae bacterium]
MNDLKVWYLFHSGFAVKHKKNVFIFDYYNNIPKNEVFDLNHGVVNPEEIKDCHVYVFVSHSHYDHYNSIIFTWADVISDIHYIVSDDLKLNRDTNAVTIALPDQTYHINDITVETLKSNDMGVAYIVKSEGLNIFHSGDLNWWVGSNTTVNAADELIFKEEYGKLKDHDIDLAFIPVSPKLEENYSLSIAYFLKNIAKENCYVFPMHFALNIRIFQWLERDGLLKDPRLQTFMHRGLITSTRE